MILSVGNSWTRVHQATEDEIGWLVDFLSFEDANAAIKRRMGKPAPQVRLVDRGNKFPTGLLPLVQSGADRASIRLDLVDHRSPMTTPPAGWQQTMTAPPWTLRPYQVEQVEAVLAGTSPSAPVSHPMPGRGIVWSPTASGKGMLAASLAHLLPGCWLFVVHRGNLARDVHARWNRLAVPLGEPPTGYIGDGSWDPGTRLTCATLQTLYARRKTRAFKELADRVTGVIADECHVWSARTAVAVMRSFTNAGMRVGLSGTPLDRGDQRSLVAVGQIGPVVHYQQTAKLRSEGWVTAVTVRLIPCEQQTPPGLGGMNGGDKWRTVYDALVVNSSHRNGAAIAATHRARRDNMLPAMVFVRSLHHGRQLTKWLAKEGYNATFVNGDKDALARDRAVVALRRGSLDVIVSSKVFVEGVDIPELRCVINCAGGKSVIECLQQLGRAMRLADGKTEAVLYDFGDKGNDWLHSHARQRVAAYQREGHSVVVDRTIWPESAP